MQKNNLTEIVRELGPEGRRQKMRKIGLDRQDAITIFRRTFGDKALDDPLINPIAKAVGEIIEENNRKFLADLSGSLAEAGR